MSRFRVPTPWQRVFLQSPANGSEYKEPEHEVVSAQWPQDTWMRRRRAKLAAQEVFSPNVNQQKENKNPTY